MRATRPLALALLFLLPCIGLADGRCPDATVTFEVRGMMKTASGAT